MVPLRYKFLWIWLSCLCSFWKSEYFLVVTNFVLASGNPMGNSHDVTWKLKWPPFSLIFEASLTSKVLIHSFFLFLILFIFLVKSYLISCFVDIANSCFEKDSSVAFIRPQKSRQKRRKTPSMIKCTFFFEQDNESLFVSVSGIISFSN